MSQACTVNAMVGVWAGEGESSECHTGLEEFLQPRHHATPDFHTPPPPGPQGQGICLYHFTPALKSPVGPSPLQPQPWVVGPAEGLSSA